MAHLEVNTHQNFSAEKKNIQMSWKKNGACFKINV